jgi:hypothetical protein
MPNLVTKQFKISNSKNFIEQFSSSSGNSLYMFLAKPSAWAPESDTPPDPTDTQRDYAKIWDEIIAFKKISPANIVNVIRRVNWVENTIYSEYDNEDFNLLSKDFFVLNRELDVYKCISNNNGSPSRVEPTGKSLNIFITSDGYKWKYLYSISNSDRLKFLTDNWMPVRKNDDVASVAIDGGIENIKLYSGGIDYSARARVIVEGDGISANVGTRQSLGVIYDFVYLNSGSKYRFANAYVLDSGNSQGRGANIRAIISPIGGHGSDPISELGAHYIMINAVTEYNEGIGDFPAGFTYRKLGLIKNPKSTSGQVANVLTLSGLSGISLSNVNGIFLNNEFIEGITSSANAFAVTSNVVSGNGFVRYVQVIDLTKNFGSFTIGENIIGKTSGATARVANVLSAEVISDTGEIFYIENRIPITKSPDQTDSLHLVLEF